MRLICMLLWQSHLSATKINYKEIGSDRDEVVKKNATDTPDRQKNKERSSRTTGTGSSGKKKDNQNKLDMP